MKFWIRYFIYFRLFLYVICPESEFVACGELGCINYTNEWFDSYWRPINLEPLRRYIVNTRFLLINSCSAPDTLVYDTITTNPDTVRITKYNPSFNLIMLIHDFTSNAYTGWIKHLAMVLINKEQYNVIAVDWQEGAEPPLDQAVANARVVSLEIQLILVMLENNFSLIMGQVHLIGHGVGAHIAGYVGKSIRRIGRITGLDPTGPRFEGMPSAVKLTANDAFYVEVLHTDGEGTESQGSLEPMGNTDFYFNAGFDQPGCYVNRHFQVITEVGRDELETGQIVRGCSHKRAFKYYIEAIQNEYCQFVGFQFGEEVDYTKVGCVDPENGTLYCATIGLDVDLDTLAREINTKFVVETASIAPFCLSPYFVKMDMGECSEAEEEEKGYFSVIIAEEYLNNTASGTFNDDHTFSESTVIVQGAGFSHIMFMSNYGMNHISDVCLKWHFTTPFCYRCMNTTCVSHFNITHINMNNGYLEPPVVNNFCPLEGNYTLLIDGQYSSDFVKC